MRRKLFVLGLDSAPPRIIYDEYGVELKALKEVVGGSARYLMRSCHPPITIPAWISMFTGKTPGELGIYGFRHRKPGDVRESYIVNSSYVKFRAIWDEAGRAGLRVGVVGVPPTYPPRPVHGFLISDFTTPGPDKAYTFPPWLKREVESKFGPYIFDILYRSHEKGKVLKELMEMTKQHLEVVKHLIKSKDWDLMIYVEVGLDRLHHAFWRYFDKEHPRYEEHSEYSRVIPEYYKLIDDWLSEVRELMPRDTAIVVVSDHGTKAMKGAFVINQWLEEKGYLKLKEKPKRQGQDLSSDVVDWSRTLAWGWGGYYARVFINLEGREPQGIVKRDEYESLVEQLKRDFKGIRGPQGEKWDNKAFTPYELYPTVNGDAPDLIVYFDDLSWRSAGTIGWDTLYLPENDRGPDDAVHDWHGVFAIYDPEGTVERGDRGEIPIERVYHELMELLNLR